MRKKSLFSKSHQILGVKSIQFIHTIRCTNTIDSIVYNVLKNVAWFDYDSIFLQKKNV